MSFKAVYTASFVLEISTLVRPRHSHSALRRYPAPCAPTRSSTAPLPAHRDCSIGLNNSRGTFCFSRPSARRTARTARAQCYWRRKNVNYYTAGRTALIYGRDSTRPGAARRAGKRRSTASGNEKLYVRETTVSSRSRLVGERARRKSHSLVGQ